MKTEIIDYFKEIKFDEASHSYTVKGKNLKPVSYVLKDFQEPFDEQKMAFLVAKKKGVSIKEVLDDWHKKRDDSCELGTNAHAFAENYVKTREGKPSNGYEKAMQTYLDKMPHYVVPLCTELQMYSEKWGIAGTADLMFYDSKKDNIILRDYKTNLDLFKNYKGKRLLAPFDDLEDNPFNKYQLQLSLYQILFEQTGFKIENRALIWVKEDGTYEIYRTNDYRDRLIEHLNKNYL